MASTDVQVQQSQYGMMIDDLEFYNVLHHFSGSYTFAVFVKVVQYAPSPRSADKAVLMHSCTAARAFSEMTS